MYGKHACNIFFSLLLFLVHSNALLSMSAFSNKIALFHSFSAANTFHTFIISINILTFTLYLKAHQKSILHPFPVEWISHGALHHRIGMWLVLSVNLCIENKITGIHGHEINLYKYCFSSVKVYTKKKCCFISSF